MNNKTITIDKYNIRDLLSLFLTLNNTQTIRDLIEMKEYKALKPLCSLEKQILQLPKDSDIDLSFLKSLYKTLLSFMINVLFIQKTDDFNRALIELINYLQNISNKLDTHNNIIREEIINHFKPTDIKRI